MKISVCTGQSCNGRFSEYIITRLKNDKERFNLETLFIDECPCTGNCQTGPNIKVDGDVRPYMNPAKASVIAMNNGGGGGKKKKKKKNKKSNIEKNTKPENLKKEEKKENTDNNKK